MTRIDARSLRRRLSRTGAVALAIVAAPAMAGPVYFHKPAVSRDAFVAEATECEELAAGVQAPAQYQPYAANPYAAGTAAFLAGFMSSREKRGMIDSVLRTCMADKGYRRVELSTAMRRDLSRLSDSARLDRLAALAASAAPDGKVLPR